MSEYANNEYTLSKNGMKVFWRTLGQGEPLLLLHGFTGIGEDWDLIFKNPPKGYQLIIPDLRGHGRSTNPSRKFSISQCASDIFSLLDSIKINKFKAIGMSAGAQVLLHMAIRQTQRVTTLVLVSTSHYFPKQARDLMAQFTTDGLLEQQWQELRLRHKNGDDQIRDLFEQGMSFKDNYDDVNFTTSDLVKISAKTMIVHGDNDPFYPIEIPIEMHKSIPQSSLFILPESGHIPIFSKNTETFVNVVLKFLN